MSNLQGRVMRSARPTSLPLELGGDWAHSESEGTRTLDARSLKIDCLPPAKGRCAST
jgi:hypothetical protein